MDTYRLALVFIKWGIVENGVDKFGGILGSESGQKPKYLLFFVGQEYQFFPGSFFPGRFFFPAKLPPSLRPPG